MLFNRFAIEYFADVFVKDVGLYETMLVYMNLLSPPVEGTACLQCVLIYLDIYVMYIYFFLIYYYIIFFF